MGETILPGAALPSAGGTVVASPVQFAVSGEDNLRIRSWSTVAGQTLLVSVRAVDTDGLIQITNEAIALDGTVRSQTRLSKLAAGYVLSVAAEVTTNFVQRGQCFVQVDLVRGFDGPLVTLGTLVQGYVGTFMGLAYPGSPLTGPLDGPGFLRAQTFGPVATGADISVAFGVSGYCRLLSFRAMLAASATVATRAPALLVVDSVPFVWMTAPSIANHGAGLAFTYNWQPGVTLTTSALSNEIAVPLPSPVASKGGLLQTRTLGLQPGDQWSAPTLVTEEWINPWV